MTPRRALWAVLLLLALMPEGSRAQTALVDNRAASNTSGDPLNATGLASAHAFTTGASEYRLHSVSVNLKVYGGSVVAVKLWAGAGNAPATVVEDLGTVTNPPGGTSNVLFTSTARPVLAANTRYWVSVANVSGDFDWNITDSTANFGSGAAFDDLARESGNGGTSWTGTGVAGEYHQFAVFGTLLAPGNVDTTFGADAKGASGNVFALAIQPDRKILIGGNFTAVSDAGGTSNRNRIARLNTDGSVDTSFGADGKGTDGYINTLAVQADGKILIGGDFFSVSDAGGTTNRNRIARLHADGSVDTSFGADGKGVNGTVFTLAVQADGKILIGGNFSSVSDAGSTSNRNCIARLHTDGSVDPSFGADAKGADLAIRTLAVQADGKVLIGGDFSSVSDAGSTTNRIRIARLHADGSVDTSFGADGKGADGPINTLAVQADGKILIGGDFSSVSDAGGTSNRTSIARLNIDGSVDPSFGADGKGANDQITTFALQADGKILIGGVFTALSDAVGTFNRSSVARLDADGSVDSGFGADAKGAGGNVYASALQADGRVVLGGAFTTVSDAAATHNRSRIARLENGAAIRQGGVPDLRTFRWMRGGTAPEASRVLVEVSTDNGATYTPLGEASRIAGGWELTDVRIPAVCLLRVRDFISHSGVSSGILELVGGVSRTKTPLLTILGKKRYTTSKGKVTLRGTASDPDGDLTEVRYQDSSRQWRTARGTTTWSAKAKLKPGRNVIQVRSYDSRNIPSATGRVTVTRE